MTFTDDDLKWYKSFTRTGPKSDGTWVVMINELEALLARLEAAEAIVIYNEGYLKGLSLVVDAEYRKWRKAAGK